MKRALINWGGWDGHEPEACATLFAELLTEKNFEVDVANDLGCYTDEAYMQRLDLIVPVWTMSEISKEQEQGLLDAVRSGVGLAGWHGGMGDSFRNSVNLSVHGGRAVGRASWEHHLLSGQYYV